MTGVYKQWQKCRKLHFILSARDHIADAMGACGGAVPDETMDHLRDLWHELNDLGWDEMYGHIERIGERKNDKVQ